MTQPREKCSIPKCHNARAVATLRDLEAKPGAGSYRLCAKHAALFDAMDVEVRARHRQSGDDRADRLRLVTYDDDRKGLEEDSPAPVA